MLVQHYIPFGDAATLEACVANPRTCDPTRLAQILDGLQCGCPPDPTVLRPLADGVAFGNPAIGTNPFFGNAGVVRAMRANASANPDLAILLGIKAMDDLIADGSTLADDDRNDRGFIAETIRLLAENAPKAQPDQQARAILKLKDLTGLTATLPETASRAISALGNIQLPSKVPPSTPAVPSASTDTSRRTKILWLAALVGAAIVGGGLFMLGRLSRQRRFAPAVGRRHVR